MTEFWNARAPAWTVGGAVLVSVLGHMVALLAAGTLDIAITIENASLTEVELVQPDEPPTAVPEIRESGVSDQALEPPKPEHRPRPPKSLHEPEPVEPPIEEKPAPLQETIADFSNMTLTNDGTSSWDIQPSRGEQSSEPIAAAGTNTGQEREGSLEGAAGGQGKGRSVAVKDLGRLPEQARGLDQLVEKHYPETLKRQGVEGVARVRIRISADGKLRVLGVLSATDPAFGEACKRSLRESPPWRPALDKQGQRTTTEAPFKCEYVVR